MTPRTALLVGAVVAEIIGAGLVDFARHELGPVAGWATGPPTAAVAGLVLLGLGGAGLAALAWTTPWSAWRWPPFFGDTWAIVWVVVGLLPVFRVEVGWPGQPVLAIQYWSMFGTYVEMADRARWTSPSTALRGVTIVLGFQSLVSLIITCALLGGRALARRWIRPGTIAGPSPGPDEAADYDEKPGPMTEPIAHDGVHP
jgi:hypothetical protein